VLKSKIVSLCILLLAITHSAYPQTAHNDQQAIEYAQSLDIAKLDSTLSSQRLAAWLSTGVPQLNQLSWGTSPNCGQKVVSHDVPNSELPFCVKVEFTRSHVQGWLLIVVGTIGSGPSGQSRLVNGWIQAQSNADLGSKEGYLAYAISRLSELPERLDDVSYIVQHRDVIAYTKALNVMTLDPALKSQELVDWLRTGPVHADGKLNWGASLGCDARSVLTTVTKNDAPLCITVVLGRGDIRAWATFEIGTVAKGPTGTPMTKLVSVQPMSGDEGAKVTSDKLSELPKLLELASVRIKGT